MILSQRHVGLTTYAFEDEMLQAVANGEADAAAVTPVSAGYFNLAHPDHKLTILPPDEADQRLVWNIAIGMRKPDPALREAMDKAIDKLSADGTIAGNLRPLRRDAAAAEAVEFSFRHRRQARLAPRREGASTDPVAAMAIGYD